MRLARSGQERFQPFFAEGKDDVSVRLFVMGYIVFRSVVDDLARQASAVENVADHRGQAAACIETYPASCIFVEDVAVSFWH
jgi:hypothetical protein